MSRSGCRCGRASCGTPSSSPPMCTSSRRTRPVGAESEGAMDFDVGDDHKLIRATVREFAKKEIAPRAEEMDREAAFPYEIVAGLADLGLMGVPFPEEYGGAGGDTLAYALTIEELA